MTDDRSRALDELGQIDGEILAREMTDDQEEPLFVCEGCGKSIMDGDPYHRGLDAEFCADCAPSWADVIANPLGFKTTDGDPVKFKDILRDYNLHLARGGKPEDKMVRP